MGAKWPKQYLKGTDGMSDISASERRLSAALDRINQLLESEGAAAAPTESDAGLQEAFDLMQKENQQLKNQIAELSTNSPAEVSGKGERWSDAAARLLAVNAELSAANRGLIEAASGKSDAISAVRLAFEKEIESFQAIRATEVAQLEQVMAELERLLTTPVTSGEVADPVPFKGVYGDPAEKDNQTADEDK